MVRWVGLILVCCLILAGCGEQTADSPATPIAQEPTPLLQPTPTLVPEMATEIAPIVADEAAADAPPSSVSTATPPLASPRTVTLPDVASLSAEEHIMAAARTRHNGDWATTIAHLEAAQAVSLSQEETAEVTYWLGVAYAEIGRFADALPLLLEATQPAAAYRAAAAASAQGDHATALAQYQRYLEINPDMAAYVQPEIAATYLALGDRAAAVTAYETAVSAAAHRLVTINNRQKLIDFYIADQNYAAAIPQYEAIRAAAVTQFTQGQMNYLVGNAYLLLGDTDTAYARFQQGLIEHPTSYDSYLGLVELVEAGQPVDDYQRGLVNYHAQSYAPCIAAFTRHIEAIPPESVGDTRLFLAWCYEGVGDTENAFQQLDLFASSDPARALVERGRMQQRLGQLAAAADSYLSYVTQFPDGSDAVSAASTAANIAEWLDEPETAVSRHVLMAENYSWHEAAPEALFRAGWLSQQLGDQETAVFLFQRVTELFPNSDYAAAARLWLLRTLPTLSTSELTANLTPLSATLGITTPVTIPVEPLLNTTRQQVSNSAQIGYYTLRGQDVVNGISPFSSEIPFVTPEADEGQAEAEAWLRTQLGLEASANVALLDPSLAQDGRLLRGQKLWEIGRFGEAKQELEALRESVAGNALLSYQLALYFRELGLYRSSIIAASSVLVQTGQTVFTAPKFIGRLAFPVYYADLVTAEAERYQYDPRLQFSLIRQESLFESFATSTAVAQGLSQVIPDTGTFIAQRLGWPDYQNDDLFLPYVGVIFGAYYLDLQLDSFDGHEHAALSAYNGGPGNAARWYAEAGGDIDRFVETVNFPETRLYIERIYSGYVIYRHLYP